MRKVVRLGRWRFVALLALTTVLSLAAFGGALRGGFVYDDQWTIVHNRHLTEPLGTLLSASWRGEARRQHIPDATRPAMIASTWLDLQLFGKSPAGFHADSLALAALTSAVAGLAAFALTRRRRLAALAAALFAVAPLHTEVVAAINNREDLLASLGVLGVLALLFWPGSASPSGPGPGARRRLAAQCALVAVAWGVALAAKESAAVLAPLAGLAWLWHRGHRPGWAQQREPLLLALLAVGIVWLSWRVGLRFGGDDVPISRGLDVVERVARTARYEVWATGSELLPVLPRPERAHPGPAAPEWMAALAILVGAVLLLWRRRATRAPALGLSMALVAPLASSPLVGPANEQADRFLFLGVLGGAIVWAWGLEQLGRRLGRRSELVAAGAAVAVCVALGVRATAVWHDDIALWTEATRVAPDSPRSWSGLSHAVRLTGDLDRALELCRHALELDPDYPPARVTLGYTLIRSGHTQEGLDELLAVRERAPDTPGLARGIDCAEGLAEDAAACVDAP